MNQQMDWFNFILYMKMTVRKTICWIKKNESANGLTQLHTIYENDCEENDLLNKKNESANALIQLHTIYENDCEENELLNKKKWISKWIDSTSYYIWKWLWGKRFAE